MKITHTTQTATKLLSLITMMQVKRVKQVLVTMRLLTSTIKKQQLTVKPFTLKQKNSLI